MPRCGRCRFGGRVLVALSTLLITCVTRTTAAAVTAEHTDVDLSRIEDNFFYRRGVPYNVHQWRGVDALRVPNLCGNGGQNATADPADGNGSSISNVNGGGVGGGTLAFHYAECAAQWNLHEAHPSAAAAPTYSCAGTADNPALHAVHTLGPNMLDFLASRSSLRHRIRAQADGVWSRLVEQAALPSEIGPVELHSSRGTFWIQSVASLLHSAEQLEYLVSRGKLPREFLSLSRAFRDTIEDMVPVLRTSTVVDRLHGEKESRVFVPHSHLMRAQHFLFNTLLYLPPPSASLPPPALLVDHVQVAGKGRGGRPSALNPKVDWHLVEESFLAGEIVVIDAVLSEWALEAAYRFCLEATVYFEHKPGYMGAYMMDGFRSGLFAQITAEMRTHMPRIVGNSELIDFWSYKYHNIEELQRQVTGSERDARQSGISQHADAARINLNMWLTPDSANLDPESGGMTIWDYAVLTKKEFEEFQQIQAIDLIGERLKQAGSVPSHVPYKRNRMVLFDSSLVHETQLLSFRSGYANRRINLTWLFGDPVWKSTSSVPNPSQKRFI